VSANKNKSIHSPRRRTAAPLGHRPGRAGLYPRCCRPRRRKLLLRIGYQKAANTLVLLKAHGALEKRLQPLGVEVKWAEFAAGPQLLEALNVGSVDFGTSVKHRPSLPRRPVPTLSTPPMKSRPRTPKACWCKRIHPSRAWPN
jgi:hypothetical protein